MILQLTKIKLDKYHINLYLGKWCFDKINDLKNVSVHKYHWSNLNKFETDSEILINYYEILIKKISQNLNKIHSENKDFKYWEKIVGPWLLYFITIIFDRYENIRNLDDKENIKTFIPKYNIDDWIPLDFVDFEDMISRDDWNYYIYSVIIKATKLINYEELNQKLINKKKYYRKKSRFHEKIIKISIYKLFRLIPEKFRDVSLVETSLKYYKYWYLNLKLKKFPFQYYIRENTENKHIDNKCRKNNIDDIYFIKENEFLKLLNKLIIQNMPIAYIESFKSNKARHIKAFPKKPKFIFTSSAYFSNELFKIWIAEQSLNNQKIYISVHGGHHGTALFNLPGLMTEKIADKFFTWGWSENILPAPKTSELKIRKNEYKINKKDFKICFVVYNSNKFASCITSSPTSSNFLDYLEDHEIFIKNLNKNILNHLTVRVKRLNAGWDLIKYYKNLGVKQFSQLNKQDDLKDLVNKSSIFICGYDTTMSYELLTLNVPTIFFFNEKFWRLNKKTKEVFYKLKKVNLFFESPKEIAQFINGKNIETIYEWWNNKETQTIKNEFLKLYGYSSKNYLNEWKATINKHLN